MRYLRFLVLAMALLALSACGRGASSLAVHRQIGDGALSAPTLSDVALGSAKSASGLPTGVVVTWQRVTDPLAVGYYLYRHTAPFDVANPALRTNGGTMIDQPASGGTVTFYDEFYPQVGQTFYYRLSVVDIYSEESDLSNQLSITISAQEVTGLDPASGYYGDSLTISGAHFGISDPAVDHVYFRTDALERIEAEVVSWNDTEIECTVPTGAITAPVQVEIAGTVAQSDEDFIILNPFLISVSPTHAAYGEQIRLQGDNLTDDPGPGDGVFVPGDHFLSYDSELILSWADDEIRMRVPATIASDGEIRARVNSEETNGVSFSVRPAITSVAPRRLVPGSMTEVQVVGLNFGDGDDGSVSIVDLSPEDPVEAIEIPRMYFTSPWSNYKLIFRVPEAEYGELPAIRVKRGGLSSDAYSVAMLEPLRVDFQSPPPYSTIEEPTTVIVQQVIDLERVEFFVHSLVVPFYVDLEGPEFSVTIDPQDYTNGTYYLYARALRGAEVVWGVLPFDILSLPGDTNGDGVVSDGDLAKLIQYFGLTFSDGRYHRYLDPNGDGRINEQDVSFIGYFFTGGFEGL
ncbi:MAG: hypothetical protein A2Y63_05460 [Candidatus Riflebacteria bacterium RBG_13_59_9]|nr:MAG: hypothetical protein A2Y63_05460 [Candidatus Riflebacteria bacterium RBG_13_59_9]